MKLGLSSYTFGWAVGAPGRAPACPLDENGLLDKCAQFAVKLLQIGDNLQLHAFADDRLERLSLRASQEGVELEVGARGLTVERVAQYATIARRLKARLIRFVIDDKGYHPTPEQAADILLQSQPVLNGLTLGIENHDRFCAETLRGMLEEVDSENIGICLDTANSLGVGEGLQTVLAELGPFTVNLHIKDFRVERLPHLMGFTVTGCPAGRGLVDVPSVLEQLAPFNRCHTAILELWTPPETDLEQTVAKEFSWAVQSLEYLRPFFK